MDGSEFFRDFTTREVKVLTSVSLSARISETDDSVAHVLLQMDSSDLIHPFMISNVKGLDSQTPECQNPDTILLLVTFCFCCS